MATPTGDGDADERDGDADERDADGYADAA